MGAALLNQKTTIIWTLELHFCFGLKTNSLANQNGIILNRSSRVLSYFSREVGRGMEQCPCKV